MELPLVWDAPRPYLHPLTTPAGAVLSVEAPADHPWHHALWFTIKYVNGENFWEEYDEFGLLHTRTVAAEPDGTIRAELEWVAPDGESVRVREVRTVRTEPIDADSYLIDWTEELVAPVDTVYDRTPFTTWGGYGGLTLRGAPTFTDTAITLDDGAPRDRALGEPSRWLSIQGTARAGDSTGRGDDPSETRRTEMTAGVVMFDHHTNPRFPSPWYASTRAETYGDDWANFVNAALLWDEPLTVAAGEPLGLRYRVIVHDGAWDADRIETEYSRWTR